ncbi:MAG: RNA polymerase sigma factor [Clostridia bacterium]|nr:RNA polymerase sigma factor [Clostridia bacterium]
MLWLTMLAALEETEQDAVIKLYNKYNRYIYAIALSITNNAQDAEDVLQDVMVKIIKNAEKFIGKDEHIIESQIVIYTRSTAIDLYRKNKRARSKTVPLSLPLEDNSPENEPVDVITPESIALDRESEEKMKGLLLSLSEEHRDAIELVYLHSYSVKEAAAILGITPNTLSQRLVRAKNKLKKLWEDAQNE